MTETPKPLLYWTESRHNLVIDPMRAERTCGDAGIALSRRLPQTRAASVAGRHRARETTRTRPRPGTRKDRGSASRFAASDGLLTVSLSPLVGTPKYRKLRQSSMSRNALQCFSTRRRNTAN